MLVSNLDAAPMVRHFLLTCTKLEVQLGAEEDLKILLFVLSPISATHVFWPPGKVAQSVVALTCFGSDSTP